MFTVDAHILYEQMRPFPSWLTRLYTFIESDSYKHKFGLTDLEILVLLLWDIRSGGAGRQMSNANPKNWGGGKIFLN